MSLRDRVRTLFAAVSLLLVGAAGATAGSHQSGEPHDDALDLLSQYGWNAPNAPVEYKNWKWKLNNGAPAKTDPEFMGKTRVYYHLPTIEKLLSDYGISDPNEQQVTGFICGLLLHEWLHFPPPFGQGNVDFCQHYQLFLDALFAACDLAGDLQNAGETDQLAGLCAALHSGEAFVNSGAKAHQSKCGGSGETLDPCPACSL